jgi:hypothetical protein
MADQSYGLRYELKRSTETAEVFRQRINRLERGEERLPQAAPDPRRTFGVERFPGRAEFRGYAAPTS